MGSNDFCAYSFDFISGFSFVKICKLLDRTFGFVFKESIDFWHCAVEAAGLLNVTA